MTRGHLAEPVLRTCKGCLATFETTVARRLFCTPRCGGRYADARRPEGRKRRFPRTCKQCGVEYLSQRPDGQFCTRSCHAKAQWAEGGVTPAPSGEASPNWKGGTRDGRLRRRYGLQVGDYEAMLAAQDGHCALCPRGPGDRWLAVDHCHETGRVRGLLCAPCNRAIAVLGDGPAGLQRALEYVSARR